MTAQEWIDKSKQIYDEFEQRAVIETLYQMNLINADEYSEFMKGVKK